MESVFDRSRRIACQKPFVSDVGPVRCFAAAAEGRDALACKLPAPGGPIEPMRSIGPASGGVLENCATDKAGKRKRACQDRQHVYRLYRSRGRLFGCRELGRVVDGPYGRHLFLRIRLRRRIGIWSARQGHLAAIRAGRLRLIGRAWGKPP